MKGWPHALQVFVSMPVSDKKTVWKRCQRKGMAMLLGFFVPKRSDKCVCVSLGVNSLSAEHQAHGYGIKLLAIAYSFVWEMFANRCLAKQARVQSHDLLS